MMSLKQNFVKNVHSMMNVPHHHIVNYIEPQNPTFYIRKQDFLSENGKYLYKFRAIYSEGFFGDLKQNIEFRQTKRRGRHKLEIDLKLEAIVTNIKKIAKYFEGTFIIMNDS